MKELMIIAGPCSVESVEQMDTIVSEIKDDITHLRAGAYKPRTLPTSFQGLKEEGIDILLNIQKESNIPIVSEIVSEKNLNNFSDIDIIQIGARNMQNYELLKSVGSMKKVVLLKRGFSATLQEVLASASYLTNYGAKEVIICERGIRTFSDSARFTLDINLINKIKENSDYKVIIDPSHAAGDAKYVESLALAGISAGADGLIIEVHNKPDQALSDSSQQLQPSEFKALIKKVQLINQVLN